MLQEAVKKLIIEKRLNIWNKVVEGANSDFEGNKKEFWVFISRRTKGRRTLRNKAGFLYLVQRVSCKCYRDIISV